MAIKIARLTDRNRRRLAASALFAVAAVAGTPRGTRAAGPGQFVYYFNNSISLQGGTGALGGFVDTGTPADPQFYTLGFVGSTQGIYQDNFNTSTSTWSSSLFINNQTSGTNDWLKFALSSSVAGNGTIVTGDSATPTVGDMILNPDTVTVSGITYAPGTLGIIIDSGKTKSGSTTVPSLSKLVYAYDLRAVTYDPNTLMENNPNAGPTGTPPEQDRNGDGIVEWNDVFTPIVSFADQQALNTGYSSTASNSVGRRPAFSSDGQSIYFTDASTAFGGLYKVNITQTGSNAISKILNAPLGSLLSEPAVLASSVRNFGGGSGDQIIFGGGADTGNTGGVNYVVDNGTITSAPKTLLSAKQIAWFFDQPAGGTASFVSFAADSSGDVYLLNNTTAYGGAIEDDAQGRLVKVFSQAEQRWFEYTEPTPVAYVAGSELVIEPANVTLTGASAPTTINQLQYRDSNTKAPVGVNLYLPGDFNHDGVVDATDIALFKQQIGLRGVPSATISTTTGSTPINSTTDGSSFATSNQAAMAGNAGVPFEYDLNGSYTNSSTGTVTAAVDWKDVKIFQQFAGFSDGDVNMDGAVNYTDLNTMASNYGLTNKIWTDGKLSSVRVNAPDANTVGFVDLITEAANWPVATLGKPAVTYNASGGTDLIPSATLDRAFAITSGGTISQIANTSTGSVNWGTAATWTNGDGVSIVPNSPGAVASLLNKATNDTTVNIGGNYAVGQLNFDNYFTYTLSGAGTLHLAGNNGTAAEINTFAASPVISAAVSLDSPTNITIAYSTDVATFSGPISGTGSLTKLGAGTVLLTGGNRFSGGTNVSAGSLQVQTPASLPGYATAAKVLVGSGAALILNVGGSNEWSQATIDPLRANANFASGSLMGFDTADAAGSFSLASNFSGYIGLIKQGANMLQLTGSNTYNVGTMITAGTLEARTPASLPHLNTLVVVSSGATLAVNVGGAGEWTSGGIDSLRLIAGMSPGSALGIDTTDAATGFTYASNISGSNVGLAKLGPNTLTLTGANTYNGSTSVLGGTLQLNFAAATTSGNIVNSTSPLVLQGNGGLTVIGKASITNTQTFAGLTLNPGQTAIVATAATSNPLLLALGFTARSVGATADFTLPAGTQSAANGITMSNVITTNQPVIGGWATIGQTDWATKPAGSAYLIPLPASSYVNDTWSATGDTTVTMSSAPPTASLTYSLRFNAPASNTITLSGVNQIASGGILITPNVGANSSLITGGTLTPQPGTITGQNGIDLIVNQFDTAGNFEIDSVLADAAVPTGLTKSGGGLLTLTAANSYSGPTYINAGTVNISSGSLASSAYTIQNGATLNVTPLTAVPASSVITTNGTVNFAANPGTTGPAILTLNSLLIENGGLGTLADPGAGNHANRTVLVVSALTIAGGTNQWNGRLDLTGNDMVIHNGSLATLTNQVGAGFNAGAGYWNGTGITSSTAAADTTHLTALGVILNNDGSGNPLYGTGTALGLFDGLSPAMTDVLTKFTWFGDANLDGKVDGSDYSRIDSGFLNALTGWFNGDFNYDGVIDGSDYTLIDNAFNTQGASLAVAVDTAQIAAPSSAVPEPASAALLSLAAATMLGRRRR